MTYYEEKFDMSTTRKEAEDSGYLGNGDIYKYKEGQNRFRLMSRTVGHRSTFGDRTDFKWLCLVLDRRDGKVKPHFMPHAVYKQIEELQQNPDYTFSSVPMPYDVAVVAKKAGTREVEYSLIPARKETPLTDDEVQAMRAMKPLEELQAKFREKDAERAKKGPQQQPEQRPPQSSGHIDHDAPLTDDDIPF